MMTSAQDYTHTQDYAHTQDYTQDYTHLDDHNLPNYDLLVRFLSGCPRKNRPLNFDQIFDFLQTFCATQDGMGLMKKTFRLLVIFSIPEILGQMLLTPRALKIALSSSRN